MRLHRTVWVVLLVMALWPVSSSQAQLLRKKRLVLFTTQEAEQLRLTEEEWQQTTRTRSVPLGPRIVIQSPQVKETDTGHTIETVTPTDLSVLFEENRSPVDMSSLQVQARKGFFSKSLTALLRPYIQGTTLQVKGVEVPPGRFLLEITIADRDGAKTVETYRLEARGR